MLATSAVSLVARTIKQTQRMSRVLAQEDLQREHRDRRSAQGSEKEARTHQARALVVVQREFRSQRRARDFVKAQQHSHRHQHHGHVDKQMTLRPSERGIEQEVECDRGRNRRGVHERMAPAPSRSRVIRPFANQRIADRVEDQRQHHRAADPCRRQSDHLVVEQQERGSEHGQMHPEGDRSDAVQDIGPQCERRTV